MGQWLYCPPNVRGWVGGRNWINSATLASRRQLVETLFAPIPENNLNADEQIELVAARTNGLARFTVSDSLLEGFARLDPATAAGRLVENFLAVPVAPAFRDSVGQFIAGAGPEPAQRQRRVRRAAVTLLQSPEYQLC